MRAASDSLPPHIEQTLTVLVELNKQIRAADKDLRSIVRNDEACRRLMTVPGVGPVTAVRSNAKRRSKRGRHDATS
jgi:transposase